MKNLKLTGIHSNIEQTIMSEEKIMEIISNWEISNSIGDLLIEQGLFIQNSNFGCASMVTIDLRDGSIFGRTSSSNELDGNEPFYVDMATWSHIELNDSEVCEGNDMIATKIPEDFRNFEFTRDCDEDLSWWDNQEIDAETFVNDFMCEDWQEWIDNYETNLLIDFMKEKISDIVAEAYNQINSICEYDKFAY